MPPGLFDEDWYRSQAGDLGGDSAYEHYLRTGFATGLSPSPLFDVQYYARAYPDIDFGRIDPLNHYLSTAPEDRADPHPLFDRKYYARAEPELPSGVDPLLHYLNGREGWRRSPHPLFDAAYYLEQNPDVAAVDEPPLRHFLVWGWRERRRPHPLLDPRWYFRDRPEKAADENVLMHYLRSGAADGLSPCSLFDPAWYVSQTSDPAAQILPLRHYLETGSAAGISPHPLFDPAWYRRTQMEPKDIGIEPLVHFLGRGAGAGLDPNPLFSSAWYLQQYPDVAEDAQIPLLHYVMYGGHELRDPHPAFSATTYIAQHPDCVALGMSPLAHALGKDRPGSGQPTVFAPAGNGSAGPTPLVPPPRQPEAELSFPPGHRRLAGLVTRISDEASARRVLSYFRIIESLELEATAGMLSRQEKLDNLITHMRTLSERANDARPIEATVIIPSYNHVEFTLAAVISLLEHRSSTRFEIIIGNDISDDETAPTFEAVGGILRCLTHEENEGFIRNCNLSALHATGTYIVPLNNDTIILDDWLDALLAPFARFERVGLTGSKLLMGDGRLQEAGGIIWRDASGWNFGRDADPTLPDYSYVKDVDYISGASIAIPRVVWEENGGFDERYIPAYFEDSDLAFALRAKGLRTLYVPASMLIHHEGISHGTDTGGGIKAHQLTNRVKFIQKWKTSLADQCGGPEELFVARDRSRDRRHMLIIDHYIPQFDRDAGSRTIFQYCRLFADAGYQISFWPDNLYYDGEYAKALQALGIEVLYGSELVNQFGQWMRAHGKYLDYVFLSRAHIFPHYIAAVREHSNSKVLFYGHDLAYVRLQREYEITGQEQLTSEIQQSYKLERDSWLQSDLIYYPAREEVETVLKEVPDKAVRLLTPYMYPDHEIAAIREQAAKSQAGLPSLIFVGGFRHRPNVDAAIWLAREILPLVKAAVPGVSLTIVGSFPPAEVTNLAAPNVIVTGFISDALLQRLYQTTTVSVAPLRFGAGVKGKIVEALRFGIAVVTTRTGAEGMTRAEEFLEIADTAAGLADCVIRLLRDTRLRRRRILNGLDAVKRDYSYSSAAARLAADLPELEILARGGGTLRQQ